MTKREFKKILISGISGSGGSYLAEQIIKNHPGVEVNGISRWHSTSTKKNLKEISDKVKIYECDLMDFGSILRVLNDVKPDAIFHLASYANVRASFETPLAVVNNNVIGTANLLEAIRTSKLESIVQMCSSSEVYGQVDKKNIPITEECPIKPINPYAVSKLAQEALGYSYFKSWGVPLITTRMFAYLNPRRDDLFATSFAMQVARIELGKQKELLHGNLDSTRTLIDIRDAMESYWVATTNGKIGETYNIGGEKIIKVGEFLDVLKNIAKSEIPSKVDKNLLRPVDVTLQIPNTNKFIRETGWKPKYNFEESVAHLLEYCRKEVFKESRK